ncbi:MAG: transcriptional regulator [Solirubrobacterales bacterium]|nr:transcriptional regulator [Solirubrobacterales bacterium]
MTPTRLHQVAMRDLLRQIVRGDLEPGERLPKELDLAELYGISRGVARESIRGLEERRLIDVRHGRGQTVAEPENWDVFDPEVLAALLESDRGELLGEVLEAQKIFEIEAAGLAARNSDGQDLEELRQAVDALAGAAAQAPRGEVAAERYRAARVAFHRRLVRAAGNRALTGMTEPIYRALATARLGEPASSELADEVQECRQILAAVVDGDDVAAMEAVDEHLTAFARRLVPR